MNSTIIDHGRDEIRVGGFVGFKHGIEVCGRVVEIRDPATLIVSVYDSITGERSNVSVNAYRAWKEADG